MPSPLQRADDRAPSRATSSALLRQRAIADHRILRVGVNVEHRRVIERDADGAAAPPPARAAKRSGERATSPLRPSVAIGGHSVNGRLQPRDRARPPDRRSPRAEALAPAEPLRSTSSATCSGSAMFAREENHAAEAELTGKRTQLRPASPVHRTRRSAVGRSGGDASGDMAHRF